MITVRSSSTHKCSASFRSVLTSIIFHLQTICLLQCIYKFTNHLYSKFLTTTFSGSLSHQTEIKLMYLYDHRVLTVGSQKHLRQFAHIPVLIIARHFWCRCCPYVTR